MRWRVDLAVEDLKNLLEVKPLDTYLGAPFGLAQKRDVRSNRLTLVIGIGGSGVSVVKRASAIAWQKFMRDNHNYVKFLAIDSDQRLLDYLKRYGLDTLCITHPRMTKPLVIPRIIPFYREFIRGNNSDIEFYDGSFSGRLDSKVKLYDQHEGLTNDRILQDKIAGYFEGDWAPHSNCPVEIIIVTSISGSTGSGTFLDIAVRAKNACPNPNHAEVFGYLMLPDTSERLIGSELEAERLYRNGFAALKELESCEGLNTIEEREEIFPAPDDRNSVKIVRPVIDYPILVSGDHYEATEMIAQTIIDIAADSNGGMCQTTLYPNLMWKRQFMLFREEVSRFGILKQDACPEDSHMYCGIGYSNASIPEKIVIPHIIGEVCRRLYIPSMDEEEGKSDEEPAAFFRRETSLNRPDYMTAMRQLLGLGPNEELTASSLWNKINRYMTHYCMLRENPVEISYDEVVSGQTNTYQRGFGTTIKIISATDNMQKEVNFEIYRIRERAGEVMKNFGPRIMRYLYDGIGTPDEQGAREDYSDICLKTQIEYVMNRFSEQRPGIKPPRPEPLTLVQRLRESFTHKRLDEWKEQFRKCEEMNVYYAVVQNMAGENGIWQRYFIEPLKDFLWDTEIFAVVLEMMSEFYQDAGKSLRSDDFREFASRGEGINGFNLCRDAETYSWVKEKINSKISDIKNQDVRDQLVDDFYANGKAWTSYDRGTARKQFDEIMSKICSVGKYANANNGTDLTISDYFEHLISNVPQEQQQREIDRVVGFIVEELLYKSEPGPKMKRDITRIYTAVIMLPQYLEGGYVGSMVKQAFTREGDRAGLAFFELHFVSSVDSIVCHQSSIANALSELADIDQWENAYNNRFMPSVHTNNGEIPVLHMDTGHSQYVELTMTETIKARHSSEKREILPMWEGKPDAGKELDIIYGTGLSWEHYPSVNVTRYGNRFDEDGYGLETVYRRDVFSKKIEEALALQIIECDCFGHTYQYYINLIPREWTDLSIEGYEERHEEGPEKGRYVRGKKLFDYLAGRNPDDWYWYKYRKPIYIEGSPFFGENGFDFTEAVAEKHWTQEQVDRERKAYLMRMMRKLTGLYQDMEDTLFKYYPIEYELQKREQSST